MTDKQESALRPGLLPGEAALAGAIGKRAPRYVILQKWSDEGSPERTVRDVRGILRFPRNGILVGLRL